jgi:hypothetical protein
MQQAGQAGMKGDRVILQVESGTASSGEEEPIAFALGARHIVVVRIVDRWPGADHVYFKVAADDGATYILRHDLAARQWEMTLFQSPGSPP